MSQPAAAARALVAERAAGAAGLLAGALAAAPSPLGVDLAGLRGVRTTGLGSSAAHARFLAHLLAEHAGLPARFVPTGAFLAGPPPAAADELLVVFSQGLSPNARFALAQPRAWRRVVLVCGVQEAAADEARRELLAQLREAGALMLALPGGEERGALLRVAGPLCGYAVALALARTAAAQLGREAPALVHPEEPVVAAVRGASAWRPQLAEAAWRAPLALLASGSWAELVENLRLKLLEGLLRPLPPVHELLAFAHGPFQQLAAGEATLLALTREDAEGEEELLARVSALLDPARHHLLRVPASLPGPFAIFEHEARLSALVLARMEAEAVDPVRFPGRGADAPLYGFAPETGARAAELTSPEIAARLGRGATTAVLGLGATEQHGPHLPLATDTWIAEALALRFCARVPEAVCLPALAFGCSPEHMDFPGTLSVAAETLEALLSDLLASLARHGFARAFVFSAHGGNCAPLREALPRLAAACAPLELCAFTDLGALTRRLHAVAAAGGVDAAAAGHHAGEIETSILWALRPGALRAARAAPGALFADSDAQALFHPSLRGHAESGVVGDPRGAGPERAEAYLRAWTDLLVEAYRGAVNPKNTKGTQKA